MNSGERLDLDLPEEQIVGGSSDGHNVTDWALGQFRERYGEHITKDGIWEYMYGVMHAPDWRERYKHDLQRNLPRIPFASDFEAFSRAGRELMALHVGYETCPEHPDVVCEVEGKADEGGHPDPEVYRIAKLKWGKKSGVSGSGRDAEDRSVLYVNNKVRLTSIPDAAHAYTVSGRSPLAWAVDSLRHKHDKKSGITDDPNGWQAWADDPFELVRHLRRLIWLSVRSAEVIAALPPSLDEQVCSPASLQEV